MRIAFVCGTDQPLNPRRWQPSRFGVAGVQEGATWGIDRIDSRDGTDSRYDDSGAKGGGALVYILDTGVRISHVDFGGRAEAS